MDNMEEIELHTIGEPNAILEFLASDQLEQIMNEVVDTNIVYTEDDAPVVKKTAPVSNHKTKMPEIVDLLDEAKGKIDDASWLNKYEQLKNKL